MLVRLEQTQSLRVVYASKRAATAAAKIRALAHIESGNKNIHSGVDPDPPGYPGGNSQGYFQINTPTWRDFAKGTPGEEYPRRERMEGRVCGSLSENDAQVSAQVSV
jgi:hypothetical protein